MEHLDPFCWEITKCDEHRRVNCPAYRSRRNCWEVMGTPVNGDFQSECEYCKVILSRIARAIAVAIGESPRLPAKR